MSANSDFNGIDRRIFLLINNIEDSLTQRDVKSMIEYVKVGEANLAIENLCTQLYEYQSPLSMEVYNEIRELSEILRIDPEYWLILNQLVKKL